MISRGVIIAVIVLIAAVGAWYYYTTILPTQSTPVPQPPSEPSAAGAQSGGTTLRSFTIVDIVGHSSQSDCWSVIDGSVYNLTGYLSTLSSTESAVFAALCGIDGSSAFHTQRPGTSAVQLFGAYRLGIFVRTAPAQ